MSIEPPFDVYIYNNKWDKFINDLSYLQRASRKWCREFYCALSELTPQELKKDKLSIHGKVVDFSARRINLVYNTPHEKMGGYDRLKKSCDSVDLATVLTGAPKGLGAKWSGIPKTQLKPEASLLNTFVSSRLMPVVVNSRVKRKRAICIYAILKGYYINVGQLINEEIKEVATDNTNVQALGFPCLITTLIKQAGVDIYASQGDFIAVQATLRLEDFGRQRRAQHEPDEDNNQDQEEGGEDETSYPGWQVTQGGWTQLQDNLTTLTNTQQAARGDIEAMNARLEEST
ncbi:hypothetical protein, partial [Candidatus Burkholderia verschuerenii]|uniref:hypothetical protein n=1 Tax=Candidatus Burkholderia verschuerenii TaxID=242163 RepID=UPI0018DCB4CC